MLFRSRTSERSTRPVLACKIRSQFPLCLGIKRAVLEQVRERLARRDLSIHGFIESADPEILSEAQLRDGGFEPSIFKNLNTPEDYA